MTYDDLEKDTHEPTLHDVMAVLGTMHERFDGVDSRLGSIERRVGVIEEQLDTVQETLHAVARAVDSDSVTLINHERRIKKLERVQA